MTRRTLQLCKLEDRLAPATWDGGGADNSWSSPLNWVGDLAPLPSEVLNFPAGAARLTSVNDLPAGLLFDSINITGGGYQISGAGVTLLNGLNADIAAAQNSSLGLVVAGGGGLRKAGPGTLILTAINSYLGVTNVNDGVLEARANTALGSSGATNETVVADGATLALGGNITVSEAITIAELVTNEPNAFALRVRPSSNVTLNGALTVAAAAGSSPAIVFADAATSALTITSGIGETGGVGDVQFQGLNLGFSPSAVNTLTGQTQIASGSTALFNGQGGVSPVSTVFFSVIGGTGSTGPLTVGGLAASDVSAGTPTTIGTLATGNFLLQARIPPVGAPGQLIVNVTSNGTTATADRINVTGSVQLGGILSVRPTTGVRLPVNSRFVILANDGIDAVQGTFNSVAEGQAIRLSNGSFVRVTYLGGDGNDVELITASSPERYAVALGRGSTPIVKVYDRTGFLFSITAYDPSFQGGVRVAVGDVNADGVQDIVTAAGADGGPHVRVFDGVTRNIITEFFAYDPAFTGGIFVAVGDVNGDSALDIITGAGSGGGPHVKAFSATNGAVLSSFFAYDPAFRGGVTVAAGDVLGDGATEIITGPGRGGGPHVRIFSGAGVALSQFFAYEANFGGGIFVAAGNVDATGKAEVITGVGVGGGPLVRAFDGLTGLTITSFFAYNPSSRGGVTVATGDIDGDGRDEMITAPGPGGAAQIKAWELPGPVTTFEFFAFDQIDLLGAFVG